jgi:hypothetical protein
MRNTSDKLLGFLVFGIIAISCLTLILVFKSGMNEDNQEFKNRINHLTYLIDHSDWEKAENEVKKIKKATEKNHWKLDLVGLPMGYAELVNEIAKLEGAVKEKNKLQATIELSAVRDLGKHIFSL